MRKVWRWLHNSLAVFLLLICAAILILLIRSYWHADVFWVEGGRKWLLQSNHGILGFSVLTEYPVQFTPPSIWTRGPARTISPTIKFGHAANPAHRFTMHLQFRFLVGTESETMPLGILKVQGTPILTGVTKDGPILWIPGWAVVVLMGFYPGFWIYHVYKQRKLRTSRLSKSLCATCGYDLRATPDRCPECGTLVSVFT